MNFRRWVQSVVKSSPAITRKSARRLRKRALEVERLETRKLLAAAPYSTLELLRETTDARAATIRLDTYEFSYKTPLDPISNAPSAPKIEALSVSANHTENGASVFTDVAKIKVFARAVLTQRDNNGDAVSAWIMTNVQLLNERVNSESGSTIEDLQFSFRQITEASSLTSASWDNVIGRTTGPVVPPEINLRPYAPTSSFSELQLFSRSTDSTPTIVLKLNDFRFGIHNPFNETQALQGQAGNNSALKVDSLIVSSLMTGASPALFRTLTTGSAYSRGIITQRQTDGTVAAAWTLAVVSPLSQTIDGQDDNLPALNLSFSFGTLGSKTGTSDYRWDIIGRAPAAPGSNLAFPETNNLVYSPIPPSSVTPTLSLELSGGTASPVSLILNSFSLGTHSNGSFRNGVFSGTTPSFEPLVVSSALTTDTPLLYKALLTAQFYTTGTLIKRDALGSPIAVWSLDTILVSDATFSGFGDATNGQELTFRIGAITEATRNASASWSQVLGRPTGPAIPSGLTLTTIPAKPSEISLSLYSSVDGNLPVFTIPLDDFTFGSSATGVVTDTSGGATTFDQLVVSGQMQGSSPSLLAALNSGRRFGKATLTRNSASAPLTLATFGNVYITDDLISGDSDAIPNQQFKLLYSQITQSANGVTASWDALTKRAEGPAPLPGPDLASLPAATGKILFELKQRTTDANPIVSINLDSVQYGFDKVPGGVGLDTLLIRTALGRATPVLFGALARQSRFEFGQVTQFSESGAVVSRLSLGNVFLTSNHTSGLSNGELVDEYGLSYTTFRQDVGPGRAVWNFSTNKEEFGGTGGALPTGEAPANSLVLQLSDGTNPAITIPLNTFEFAYENQYPAGAPALSVYKPLTITFDLTSSSPALFTALARGTVFRDASIKKFEGDRLVGGWLLSSVVIQSDNTSSVGSQTTKSLTLTYANLTLVAGTETKLTTSSSSTTYGQSLTFTAVVTSTGVAVTSGSVAFSIGSTQLALVPVNSSGRASFTTTTLNVSGSPYTIDAVYLPSATLLASSASVGVSVSAATLTIYPSDNQSKVYGDALPALSFIATGLVNNDASTLVTGSLGTTATASSAVGSYPFTLGTLSAGSNYVLALANPAPQFTVSAVLLTILPDENQSKIYGDNNPALTYTASGLKNNDPISVLSGALATTATTSSSVGSYPFALGTLTAGSNYSLVLANNAPTFTVKAASLTITPDAGQSKSYGSAVPTLSFTASGLKNNDAASIVVGQLGTTATASSSVGSYPFTLGSLAAGNNYVLALTSSAPQFTVNAATLTILPDANQSKIYGDSNPSLTFTSSGLVNNDPASIVIGQLGTTATSSSVVGSYPFTLGSLSAGSNYVLALSSSAPQFAVNAATLTICPMPINPRSTAITIRR